MSAADILSVLGGFCEFVGLVIVAAGIVRDQRQAGKLFEEQPPPEPRKRTYPPPVSPPSGSLLANPAFTAAHNQREIAGAVTKLGAATANAFRDMRIALDEQLDQSLHRLQTDTVGADNELRRHLRYVLAESARDRWIGVILLGVGIVLTTLGSIV